MSHILKDYQETHRYESKKKRISAGKILEIAIYAGVIMFVIHVIYKGYHRNEKRIEPAKEVLKVEVKESYV